MFDDIRSCFLLPVYPCAYPVLHQNGLKILCLPHRTGDLIPQDLPGSHQPAAVLFNLKKRCRCRKFCWMNSNPFVFRHILPGRCILVKYNQFPMAAELLEDGFTVAATPKSAVNIYSCRVDIQALYHFMKQYRNMVASGLIS